MKKFIALLAVLLFHSPAFAFSVDFEGDFEGPQVSSRLCAEIFNPIDYKTIFRTAGAGRNILVTRFENERKIGHFHGKVFVTNLGYNNDFLWDEIVSYEGDKYRIEGDGILTNEFTLIKIKVTRLDEDLVPLCFAISQYFGRD